MNDDTKPWALTTPHPTEQIFTVHSGTGPLITFHRDGRITVAEDAQPTETARKVLEALAQMWPQWIRDPGLPR